ncbi:3-keto-disaccharide hydrolase [Fimbriiglobus ruber]|uniref:Putative glycosyl hydrolase (Putative secreted protein) n=1 Tax=Fimbriiglobus ruber TaxID=1908690 RepID=A0A225DSF7_9BACT|nr:DUF1080 domain-containing protein [Fimbriiglobus ruber]OWK44352.1 putative glycosyl hydrolase (putative secreted protein) [Fimbriiglobus ruber]
MFLSTQAVMRCLVAAAALVVSIVPVAAEDKKSEDGWIQLFNGKDLTGWKIPNPPSGHFKEVIEKKNDEGKVIAFVGVEKNGGKEVPLWRVEDGTIIGGGPSSHIFTESGDYDNFHYRVEAKINDHGNSGQYFRTKFGPGFPAGYETQINATHGDPIKTGSIYPAGSLGKYKKDIVVLNTAPHKPDEFFTQEVIADGPHITVIVNGKQTIDWTDPDSTYTKGHFALQGHDPGSVMTFKKVEYKPIKK